jgi:hypothetical protein
VTERQELLEATGIDRQRVAALEELVDAVQAALPKLRKAERQGIDCGRELDALELALERLNPVPPLTS